MDPYRLTHAAVRAAKEKGARIYENTTASAINQSAQDDITLECSTHHRIQARYVIVAAGLETHRYCGGLTQAGTTYLLATEPVEEFAGWRGTCLIHREGDAGSISPSPPTIASSSAAWTAASWMKRAG